MSDVYNYTFTGFGSQIKIDTTQTICTGCSVNFGQKLINSQGSIYNGQIFISNAIQTNMPTRLDVPEITISLNFQVTVTLMQLLKDMINNRTYAHSITINGVGNSITLKNCYWNKIGLQVSQNSLMTCSIDFNVVQKYNTIYSFVFFARNSASSNTSNYGLYGLNKSTIIPYYATSVQFKDQAITFNGSTNTNSDTIGTVTNSAAGSSNFVPTGWSLDITQQINFRTFCRNRSSSSSGCIQDAPISKHVSIGMMNSNINITTLVDSSIGYTTSSSCAYMTISSYTMQDNNYITVYYINPSTMIKTLFITLRKLYLTSANPTIQGSNYLAFQLSYQVGKIVMPSS